MRQPTYASRIYHFSDFEVTALFVHSDETGVFDVLHLGTSEGKLYMVCLPYFMIGLPFIQLLVSVMVINQPGGDCS